MAPDDPLESAREEKEAQVLRREGVEEELMEEGESDEGEEIADVQESRPHE
ncbi:MAG: hypothetical protein M3179_04945 [Actinomycetota bacterium]|nr:hypothetical protein [Actinomycetota bacterium]